MENNIDLKLVIGISASALFDLTEEDNIFRTQATESEYAKKHYATIDTNTVKHDVTVNYNSLLNKVINKEY